MTYYVYTLALNDGKYYITHSVTALEDAVTFFRNCDDEWIRRHPISHVHSVEQTTDVYDIDKTVIRCMDTYGAYNIRGGTFSFDAMRTGVLYSFLILMSKRFTGCFLCANNAHSTIDCDTYISDNDSEYVPPSHSPSSSSTCSSLVSIEQNELNEEDEDEEEEKAQ